MTDKKMFVYQIAETNQGIVKDADNKTIGESVSTLLSKHHIYWDEGQAVYYRGFDNHYKLIGMLRAIMSEPLRNAILQTSIKMDSVFVLGIEGYVVIWTGDWTPLEKAGFIGTTLIQSMFSVIVNDINKSVEANKGILADRV